MEKQVWERGAPIFPLWLELLFFFFFQSSSSASPFRDAASHFHFFSKNIPFLFVKERVHKCVYERSRKRMFFPPPAKSLSLFFRSFFRSISFFFNLKSLFSFFFFISYFSPLNGFAFDGGSESRRWIWIAISSSRGFRCIPSAKLLLPPSSKCLDSQRELPCFRLWDSSLCESFEFEPARGLTLPRFTSLESSYPSWFWSYSCMEPWWSAFAWPNLCLCSKSLRVLSKATHRGFAIHSLLLCCSKVFPHHLNSWRLSSRGRALSAQPRLYLD